MRRTDWIFRSVKMCKDVSIKRTYFYRSRCLIFGFFCFSWCSILEFSWLPAWEQGRSIALVWPKTKHRRLLRGQDLGRTVDMVSEMLYSFNLDPAESYIVQLS